jgi:hypothetical protein
MSETTSNDEMAEPSSRKAVPPGWVKLTTFGLAGDAELSAAILAAQGIESEVFGANTNNVDWFWQMFNDVDLIVRIEDAPKAREILANPNLRDLEPVAEPAGELTDEKGRRLVQVAAYDNAIDLRDAKTVLDSAGMTVFVPRLVLRGDRPAGVGNRFIVRVAEDDVEKATRLLEQEADDDKDQPRCPQCGSWRVRPVKGFIGEIAGAFGLGKGPTEMVCGACKYRGEAGEFLPG